MNINRPFGPAVTPEEMATIHAMEDMFNNGGQNAPKHENVVDQPDHYKHGTFQFIDELVLAFGIDATINFCIMNAWKYRARAPFKDNLEQDMEKADRYMQYAHDLQLKKVVASKADGGAKLPLLMSPGTDMVAGYQEGGNVVGPR